MGGINVIKSGKDIYSILAGTPRICDNSFKVLSDFIFNSKDENVICDEETITGNGKSDNKVRLLNLEDDKLYLIKNGAYIEYEQPTPVTEYNKYFEAIAPTGHKINNATYDLIFQKQLSNILSLLYPEQSEFNAEDYIKIKLHIVYTQKSIINSDNVFFKTNFITTLENEVEEIEFLNFGCNNEQAYNVICIEKYVACNNIGSEQNENELYKYIEFHTKQRSIVDGARYEITGNSFITFEKIKLYPET